MCILSIMIDREWILTDEPNGVVEYVIIICPSIVRSWLVSTILAACYEKLMVRSRVPTWSCIAGLGNS